MLNRQLALLIATGIALSLAGCDAPDGVSTEGDVARPASNGESEARPLPEQADSAGAQDEPEADAIVSEVESVSMAKADLAKAFGVPPDQIRIVEIVAQMWGDQGLGCDARKGVFQAVPVPGYRILLSYGNELYRYHTDQHGHFVRCVGPVKPLGPIIDKQK